MTFIYNNIILYEIIYDEILQMYPGGEFPQGAMGQWRLGHPELQVSN